MIQQEVLIYLTGNIRSLIDVLAALMWQGMRQGDSVHLIVTVHLPWSAPFIQMLNKHPAIFMLVVN